MAATVRCHPGTNMTAATVCRRLLTTARTGGTATARTGKAVSAQIGGAATELYDGRGIRTLTSCITASPTAAQAAMDGWCQTKCLTTLTRLWTTPMGTRNVHHRRRNRRGKQQQALVI